MLLCQAAQEIFGGSFSWETGKEARSHPEEEAGDFGCSKQVGWTLNTPVDN